MDQSEVSAFLAGIYFFVENTMKLKENWFVRCSRTIGTPMACMDSTLIRQQRLSNINCGVWFVLEQTVSLFRDKLSQSN